MPQARFVQAPAEAVPFRNRSFDVVFFGPVIHETDDPAKALTKQHRVARRRVGLLEWLHRHEGQGLPRIHRLKPETIKGLATQAGFSSMGRIRLKCMELYRLKS